MSLLALSTWGCRFRVWLGEALLLTENVERARETGLRALEITGDTKYLYAFGCAQRALGRIARAGGALAEAEDRLTGALRTFDAIQARYEGGRTHLDLAAVARAQGNYGAISFHLRDAHQVFRALRVPNYVERTERFAQGLGMSLDPDR